MGKGRHVVIHDVIYDDNEMGHRPISYQDVACMNIVIFMHNLGNSPIMCHFYAPWWRLSVNKQIDYLLTYLLTYLLS